MAQWVRLEDLSPEECHAALKAAFEAEVERSKAMRGAERRDWEAQNKHRRPQNVSPHRTRNFGN